MLIARENYDNIFYPLGGAGLCKLVDLIGVSEFDCHLGLYVFLRYHGGRS